jgi:peptidoglycan/LPS O-acetylase OafA/YrhL
MSDRPDHDRLPALDGLRGLAALAVVFLHLTMQSVPHSPPAIVVKNLFAAGWTGVDLFFVLSGFLITGILVGAKGSTNYFRVFYGRRMLRILPLYYAALIVLFGVPMLVTLPHGFRVPLSEQLWFWVYLQNYHWRGIFAGWTGHLWSLAIEEQFYLVWPLVILVTSRKQAIAVCVGLIAVSVGYRAYAENFDTSLDIYYPTQARLDGLAIGSAIALLVTETDWLLRLRRFAPSLMIVATILFVVSRTTFPVTGQALSPLGNLSVAVFYGCLLVFALCATSSTLARTLRSRFLRFYGRYSYALYVIHVPAMSGLGHIGIYPDTLSFGGSDLVGQLLYIAIVLPIVTLLAWLSWHLFEKHFLKLKRHFVYSYPGRPIEGQRSEG